MPPLDAGLFMGRRRGQGGHSVIQKRSRNSQAKKP